MTEGQLAASPETTSSLERYLAEISDPVLRENLAREIGGLKREFGLVFERHHPEGIRLPKHSVKRGSKVVISGSKDSVFYRVHRLNRGEGTAIIVDADGNQSEYALDSLTVAREFGDVMYPGMRKLSEVRRGDPDAPVHTIINGENYHALEALQYTHAGKVDLIYIDPPYNTGAADWKYNDRYVDAKDGYRHSKWLSFMEKRLFIAKQLLKPTGVLVMAIGDDEQHRLRLLTDDIFGEKNFISNVVWQGGRKNDSRYISNGADYMLIYARDEQAMNDADIQWREKKAGVDEALKKAQIIWGAVNGDVEKANALWKKWLKGQKAAGSSTDAVNRYDMLDAATGRPIHTYGDLTWPGGGGGEYDVMHPQTGKPVKQPVRGWLYKDPARMQLEIDKGRVYFGVDETTIPRGIRFLDEMDSQVAMSVFSLDRKATNNYLREILGDMRFPNPKDVNVLKRWIGIVAPKDAVVLDFFGGSGSTAEAVIRLNSEDGGTRQTILVTNNELSKSDDTKLRKAGHVPGDVEYEAIGVFHHVTKPRLETVVTGIREDGSTYSAGLDANIAFFDLTYLDEPDIVRGAAFDDLAGLFWLKAGGIGGTVELTAGAKADGFAISESGRTAVLFTPGRAQALAEKLAATEHTISHLFIVTDSEAQGDEAATHFPGGITVERIYGSYLEAFQVNRKD